jgi:superfamily II DNA or RNA helicase
MIQFEYIDPIYCRVRPVGSIRPHFTYKKTFWKKEAFSRSNKKTFWKKEAFSRSKVSYDGYLINKKGEFLAGYLPRILSWCDKEGLVYAFDPLQFSTTVLDNPQLPGITLRLDQLRLINSAKEKGRGVLKSPTGSGKTVIASGIISIYPKSKVLFLCHTLSLIKQTIAEFTRFGLGPISSIGGGSKDLSGRIVVSTMQSFVKIPIEEYCDLFDIVIVDEAHHISSLKVNRRGEYESTYPKILSTLLAPIRFGFTATLPETEEARLSLEGMIGPVIDEVSIQEGLDLDFLAKPLVKLIKVPYNIKVKDRVVTSYKDIYREGIVLFRRRHRLIIEEAKKLADQGQSSLIYVNQIEHGERLLDMASKLGLQAYFVKGDVPPEEREYLRNALHNKEILVVIATVVWKEGVNIKSLNNIMIAGGGKSELVLFQTIGRGFRRDSNKDKIVIYDFLDSGRYLSEWCVERIGIYVKNGWL